MLAHAYLAVVRLQANAGPEAKKGGDAGWDASLIPFTVPEVRRLLCRLVWQASGSPELSLAWSHWRRRHQAKARLCHYQRRLQNLNHCLRL